MNNEDPYIGQVIYSTDGKGNGGTWDDSELIEYWDKAKEAYKKRSDQQNQKAAPFNTTKRYGQKQRVEKRTPLKKKATPPPLQTRSPLLPPPPPQPQVANNDDDGLTQMIMAWYYAGYYTGLYIGGFRNGAQ